MRKGVDDRGMSASLFNSGGSRGQPWHVLNDYIIELRNTKYVHAPTFILLLKDHKLKYLMMITTESIIQPEKTVVKTRQ